MASMSEGLRLERHAQRDSTPPHETTGNVGGDEKRGAHSGARGDSRLVKLIEVWPALTDDLKTDILTLAGLRPYDFDDVTETTDAEGVTP